MFLLFKFFVGDMLMIYTAYEVASPKKMLRHMLFFKHASSHILDASIFTNKEIYIFIVNSSMKVKKIMVSS